MIEDKEKQTIPKHKKDIFQQPEDINKPSIQISDAGLPIYWIIRLKKKENALKCLNFFTRLTLLEIPIEKS